MRDKERKLKELAKEYKELKQKIYSNCSFIVLWDCPDHNRYGQLHALFYPQLRTSNWVNPLNG